MVLTCLRLKTGSNIYYIWSFTMHSISSSNFYLRSWCTSTPFYSKGARFSVQPRDSFKGIFFSFFKNSDFFHRWHHKCDFIWSTLRNRFQHLLLLKFHHALNIFIIFLRPWCTSAAFFPRRARYSDHFSDSSMRDILKKGNFFTDQTIKVVLTCLRLETGSNIYYFWIFTMHSISSSNFFLRPWCNFSPFQSKRPR